MECRYGLEWVWWVRLCFEVVRSAFASRAKPSGPTQDRADEHKWTPGRQAGGPRCSLGPIDPSIDRSPTGVDSVGRKQRPTAGFGIDRSMPKQGRSSPWKWQEQGRQRKGVKQVVVPLRFLTNRSTSRLAFERTSETEARGEARVGWARAKRKARRDRQPTADRKPLASIGRSTFLPFTKERTDRPNGSCLLFKTAAPP